MDKVKNNTSITPTERLELRVKVKKKSSLYRTCRVTNFRCKYYSTLYNRENLRELPTQKLEDYLQCELELFIATVDMGASPEEIEGVFSGDTHYEHSNSIDGCRKADVPLVQRQHHSNIWLMDGNLNRKKGGAKGDDPERKWKEQMDTCNIGRWVEGGNNTEQKRREGIMKQRVKYLIDNGSRYYRS